MFVPPDIARVPKSADQSVDLRHRGMERQTREINFGRKNLIVTSLEVRNKTRSRIHGHKVVKSTEETTGRPCRKLFRSLYNHHLAAADIDASSEYVETSDNEIGVEVGELRHRCKVLEG